MHKKGHVDKDFGFGSIIDFDEIDLPKLSYSIQLEPKETNKKKNSYKRYKQLETGQQPFDAYEQYNFDQGKTIYGEYLG